MPQASSTLLVAKIMQLKELQLLSFHFSILKSEMGIAVHKILRVPN